MFTGLYTRSHGAHHNDEGLGARLQDRFVTIAERLSDAGYLNIGVVANHILFGSGYGLEQGFDTFDVKPSWPFVIIDRMRSAEAFLLREPIFRHLAKRLPDHLFKRHYRREEQINSVAFALVDRALPRGDSLFLLLNYMDAHWPYVPPPSFDTRWPGKDLRFDTTRHFTVLRQVVRKRVRDVLDWERAHLHSQYDGAIAYMDGQVGQVVDRLKRLGIYDECLLIVTSDHGEAFGERQLVQDAISVCQDQVHVPLLIKFPGSAEGKIVDRPVSLIDLMPTIMDVLDLPTPDGVQGRSLLAPPAPDAEPMIRESYPHIFLGSHFRRVERAIYDQNM